MLIDKEEIKKYLIDKIDENSLELLEKDFKGNHESEFMFYEAKPELLNYQFIIDGYMPNGKKWQEYLPNKTLTLDIVNRELDKEDKFTLISKPALYSCLLTGTGLFFGLSSFIALPFLATSFAILFIHEKNKQTLDNIQRILKTNKSFLNKYSILSKEQVVNYNYRKQVLNNYYTSLKITTQNSSSYNKDTDFIKLGLSNGVFQDINFIGAPKKNSTVGYYVQDMMQHTIVFGGTGEGKTRTVLLPIAEQFIKLRQSGKKYGLVCMDGKGVLWRDILSLTQKNNIENELRVVGTEEGQYGVNIMATIKPDLLADVLKSIQEQVGGGGDGSVFADTANLIIKHCAVLAKAISFTEEEDDLVKNEKISAYSLPFIYRLSTKETLLNEFLEKINRYMLEDDYFINVIKQNKMKEQLDSAYSYLSNNWKNLAEETKTGVMINIDQVLSNFETNPILRERFASGVNKESESITIDDFFKYLIAFNISIIEHGLAGKAINVILKSLFYDKARARERVDSKIGEKEKVLFLADEFQEIVTKGKLGTTDMTFWNVSRSTGVMGLFATQAYSTLVSSFGGNSSEDDVNNFYSQCRSKIFLRVEDSKTLEKIKELTGEIPFEKQSEAHKSYNYVDLTKSFENEYGYKNFDFFDNDYDIFEERFNLDIDKIKTIEKKEQLNIEYKKPYDGTKKVILNPNISLSNGTNSSASINKKNKEEVLEAVRKEEEESNKAYYREDMQLKPVISSETINRTGRNSAYVYLQQLGGASLQDFILLD